MITTPGNNPQHIEDPTGKGLGTMALGRFIERMSAPAFDRLTYKNQATFFN